MSTIIVTHEDHEVDEFDFPADRDTITIGRRSSNDVCVPNLSVEDLNSTNGTYINGRLIARQILQQGDDIIMGKIRLQYVNEAVTSTTSGSSETANAVTTGTVKTGSNVDSTAHARTDANISVERAVAQAERPADKSEMHEPATIGYDGEEVSEQ